MKTRMSKWGILGLPLIMAMAVVLTLGAGTPVSAQTAHADPPADKKSTPANDEEVTVRVAGQQVAVDARTGKLRPPTPEEAKALAEGMKKLMNRSTEGLTMTQHPDGTLSVDLEGRFLNASVIRINPDGTISRECVSSSEEAMKFFGIDPASVSDSASSAAEAPAEQSTTRKVTRKSGQGSTRKAPRKE